MNLIFYFQRDLKKDVVGWMCEEQDSAEKKGYRIWLLHSKRECIECYLKYLPYIHWYCTWGSDYCRYTSGYYRHDNDDDNTVEQHPE